MRRGLLVLAFLGIAHADPPLVGPPAKPNGTIVAALPIPAALVDVIPEDGIYIASHSAHVNNDDYNRFFIARLDRAGLHEIFRGADRGYLVWATPTTLVRINSYPEDTDGELTVFTVNGLAKPKQESFAIPKSAWALRPDEKLSSTGIGAGLWSTTTGEVWIADCLKHDKDYRCLRLRYLRVHGGPFVRRAKLPDNLRDESTVARIGVEQAMAKMPAVKPPPGYSVKLESDSKYGGFVCKSPGATHHSPGDDVGRDGAYVWSPRRTRWVLASPPVFAVRGRYRTPIDTWEPYQEFHRACDDHPMGEIRILRPRIWAEVVNVWPAIKSTSAMWWTREWRLSIDAVPIGAVGGESGAIAISPPP